ncbi:MAG TPA: prolipoprotein diacylglyceryl transferase [Terriglobia bacterium]|nr:prolipoprotein diacylglyceryl transferase [Terriglobia bacterium]
MLPILLRIGPLEIPTYGVLVAAGLITGLSVASRLGARDEMKKDEVLNLGIYLALAGILGSKLALILQESDYYFSNPRQLFSLSTLQSGGIFYGGLILAILVGLWYTRRNDLPFLKTADVFAPGIALGHAIGRLGCFSAGCCWGLPTTLPWGVTFTDPHSHATVGVPLGVPLHPTQLYESAAGGILFLFLYRQQRQKQFEGQTLGWYLLLYGAARFAVEFLRYHSPEAMLLGFLSDAQGVSLALGGIGAWLLWLRPHRRELPAASRP